MTRHAADVERSLAPAARNLSAPPRIGLALGGGGARGLAHVIVLEAFDDLGLKPAIIAGTSIGAIYGAAYAAGFSAAHIRALTEETLGGRIGLIRGLFTARSDPVGRLLQVFPRRSALLNAEAIVDLVTPSRMPETFQDLPIPLRLAATDLVGHESVVLDTGAIKTAVAASLAIPVLFSPVTHNTRLLLDGGLTNPCPFDLIADRCDICVAIDVSGASNEAAIGPTPTALEVFVHSTQILQKSITRERLNHMRPDIYVDVDLDRFGALEFHKAKEILAAAQPIKDHLKRKLARLVETETLSE